MPALRPGSHQDAAYWRQRGHAVAPHRAENRRPALPVFTSTLLKGELSELTVSTVVGGGGLGGGGALLALWLQEERDQRTGLPLAALDDALAEMRWEPLFRPPAKGEVKPAQLIYDHLKLLAATEPGDNVGEKPDGKGAFSTLTIPFVATGDKMMSLMVTQCRKAGVKRGLPADWTLSLQSSAAVPSVAMFTSKEDDEILSPEA